MTTHSIPRPGSLFLFLLIMLSLNSWVVAAPIPDTDVSLEPPAGFSPANNFVGFQQIETFSSIEIRELESPFNTVVSALSAEQLAAKGIKFVGSESFDAEGRRALLLELQQEISGISFNKFLLIIGDALRSLRITASYPASISSSLRAPLRESVLTTRWHRTAKEQILADLPFVLSESEDLKFVKRSPTMLVLADISVTGKLSSQSPSIVVGYINSEKKLDDFTAIAHRQLSTLKNLEIMEIFSEGESEIDGIRAYEISARARRLEGDITVHFRQVLAFQPHRYLLTQSAVDESLAHKYEAQFAEVLASIRFR